MAYDQATVRALYGKLLALYPRAFREQLGESMEQTFNDLYLEWQRQAGRSLFTFMLRTFIETAIGIFREHLLLITRGIKMRNITTNPRSAAVAGLILALPVTILFSLLVLNIEPNFGPLEPLLNNPDPDQPDVGGSLVALVVFLLLPVAFVINLRIIARATRAGKTITAHPVNLFLAAATLALITMTLGSIIADQYPCWIGVPNCD